MAASYGNAAAARFRAVSDPDPLMRRAIALSIENVHAGRGGPFACLVARDGRIVAEGTNLVTSTLDPTAHAEVVAIRRACHALGGFQLTGCDLYTTCEPCPMCMGAIYWARPARVFYGNTAADAAAIGFDDHDIYEQIRLPSAARRIPLIPLLREEALVAFRAWETKPDRVPY
jgi:tRNA(Arg) A34 adenosine deaminase TadA